MSIIKAQKMIQKFTIRAVENTHEDTGLLARFMEELAAYDQFKTTIAADKLQKQLFGFDTNVRAWLAFLGDEPIGFILCYECFTVYHGERGLYVPGAYIIEKYRNRGYGVRLMAHVSDYALENGFEFMNWIVEDNNENAGNLYRKMGAAVSSGWSYVRVPKELLQKAVKRYR